MIPSVRSLEKLRGAELEGVGEWLKPGLRVLELGGGSGYQAYLMAARGCEVVSLDIPDRELLPLFYPVLEYDGQYIPYADASFDVVFSSSVLEHIANLPSLLAEMRRVLKPEGVGIHIVPTSIWRFWTSVTHHVYLLMKYLLKLPDIGWVSTSETCPSTKTDATSKSLLLNRITRNLWPPAHGAYSNAWIELYAYSKFHWLRIFNGNTWEVIHYAPNRLFYGGYGIFPKLSIQTRRGLSRILGSSCHVFIVRSANTETQS